MSRVLIICSIAVSVAVPLAARQASQGAGAPPAAAPATAPAAAAAEELREQRVQIGNFEVLLNAALRGAVQKFGQWVQQVAPSIYVTQVANPAVHGFPLQDGDIVFTVQQAELVGTQMLTVYLQQPGRPPQTSLPASQGSGSNRVVATGGLVEADPMKVAPSPSPEGCAKITPGPLEPNQQYSKCVREALIDAMLDNSAVLSIKPGRTLQLVHVPLDTAVQNQVYSNPSKKLLLSISAEDLKAFHDGKITRDEAKQKIVETRF